MNNVTPAFSTTAVPPTSVLFQRHVTGDLSAHANRRKASPKCQQSSRVRTACMSMSNPAKAFSCAAAAIIAASATWPHQALAGPLNSAPLRFSQSMMLEDENAPVKLRAHWDLHSIDSKTETFLMFSNDSDSVVDLWWVDYYGREVYYASISPGTTHMQPSYVTHPWVIREHISQKSILMMIASPQPAMAIVNSVM
ncbi:hypothetical protein FGB62_336g026 [Gracilaria domingensis]|nr:hypothetical protein FGB62_336g026 [Gracilaria domingensis]